jgi:hypothetical protein
MEAPTLDRRLVAILAADVEGYSRLRGRGPAVVRRPIRPLAMRELRPAMPRSMLRSPVYVPSLKTYRIEGRRRFRIVPGW